MTQESLKVLINVEILLVIMFTIIFSTNDEMISDHLLNSLKNLNYTPYLLLNI